MEQDKTASRVQELAALYEIEVTDSQAQLLVRHLELVEEVNKQFNLTRIVSQDDAVVLHILDSLLLVKYMNQSPLPFLDFGTGAGYPGIPLGIMSGREGLLLDSVGKKVKAVQSFISQLGLSSLEAVQDRVETLATNRPKAFSFITARAVASLPVLVEYAAPLLSHNGILCVSKGKPSAEEVERGDAAAGICGLKRLSLDTLQLPCDYGTRTIICYQKVRKPRVALPRANGKAKHEPLA